MSWFCEQSRIIVENAIADFNNTILVSSTALSRSSFASQTAEIINQFLERVPATYRLRVAFLTELMQANLYPTSFNTDWSLEYGNASNNYLLRSFPRYFANSTCNCLVSSSCHQPMRIGPPDLVLPGLVVGCWPVHGLRMSTLECFYSSSCINTIINYLEYFVQMDGSPPTNFTVPKILPLDITPLNSSMFSRFAKNTVIGTLIDDLFIEQWTNASLYDNYYSICAPSECRYEYVSQNDALEVVTSILSVYGGLTVSLRFIVWNAIRLHRLIKRRFHFRRTTVQPWTIQN